jgi:archaellum biogenesis ATPase FlaH
MGFKSGLEEFEEKKQQKIVPTGDDNLDQLLYGGFRQDLIHLIFGPASRTTKILLRTCVNAQLIFSEHQNKVGSAKVGYIDGMNKFYPYQISKYAASLKLSPNAVLENILISRTFTWEQMVEVLQNQIAELPEVKLLIIAGITKLFKYETEFYKGLHKAIQGIKEMVQKTNPIIVLTAPRAKYSEYKPKGGKILQHFGSVLVLIDTTDREVRYTLTQHPSEKEHTITIQKPKKQKIQPQGKDHNLDKWL